MIRGRKTSTAFARFPARPPPGVALWAIGDIHGCFDLLAPLLDHVLSRAEPDDIVAFLGDYVDRGPQSREVLERLSALASDRPQQARFLRGNHDDMLLGFLEDETRGPGWVKFGGRETLLSYGVTPPDSQEVEGWARAQAEFREALPRHHRALLSEASESLFVGDYFLAHAGARPGVALDSQTREDLLWIRAPFLKDRRPFSHFVVHGHTPENAPTHDQRRIGIDTGSYATGVLTAVRLADGGATFVQSRRQAGGAVSVVALDNLVPGPPATDA